METSVFLEKICSNPGVFSSGKDRFVRKIQVLTAKTRFSHRKVYFTSETVFYSGNLSFSAEKRSLSPVFSNGKDRFIRKIQGLTPKTRFSRGTEYFTCEIVFYTGNLSFSREKIVAIPFCFPVEKTVLLKKYTSSNTENEVFSWKSVLYI